MTSASLTYPHARDTSALGESLIAFLTPVASGILLGCSFLAPPAHWLAWISLAPVAAAITQNKRVGAKYAGMYCAGLTFNLITTDWVRTLGGGTGLSGQSAPDWLFQSQLLALFWPLTLFLGRLLVANVSIPMTLALPAVWVIHELLLRCLWALIDGTGWQIYFLGYAIVDHRYISQIADLGGVSALSLVAASVGGAIWDWLSRGRARDGNPSPRFGASACVGIAVSLLILSYSYGAWAVRHAQSTEGPNIWLMPESVLREPPAELPWRPDARGAPDVLLWSELDYHGSSVDSSCSNTAAVAENSASYEDATVAQIDPPGKPTENGLEELCRQFAVPLVIGYIRTDQFREAQRNHNSTAFVDPKEGFQGSYDKIGLVPWTEFTPWEGLTTRKSQRFNHGTTCPVFNLHCATTKESYRFASVICYDVAFPQLFRRFMHAAEGSPDFFLVCSSERVDGTGRLSRHVLNMAKVRAIECRRTLVRNVRFGHSGRIDSTGLLCDESIPQFLQSPTPLGQIPIDQRTTVYSQWGDWLPAAIVGVVAVAAGLKLRRRIASTSSKNE